MKATVKIFYAISFLILSVSLHYSDVNAEVSEIDNITIAPADTVITVGGMVQFTAAVFDSGGSPVDTLFVWNMPDNSFGNLDSTGLFTSFGAGEGFIYVSLGSLTDSAHVTVIDTVVSGEINRITIVKIKQNGQIHPKVDVIQEGSGEYKFGGFPFPLNILNGGRLKFPVGSLHQDITITLKLPQFAIIEDDSVTGFDSGDSSKVLVSGAEFIVTVDGDTISPFYFDTPVSLSLPFKRGLLAELGLSPLDIGMAFLNDSTGIDTTGITNVYIDSSRNRIIADVAHFTTVVLYGVNEVTGVTNPGESGTVPKKQKLEQNYPNPFNPETSINYFLSNPGHVSIKIYNVLGQEVRTIVDAGRKAGVHTVTWDGKDNMGRQSGSGFYFYRMVTGEAALTRKMLLIK